MPSGVLASTYSGKCGYGDTASGVNSRVLLRTSVLTAPNDDAAEEMMPVTSAPQM